MRRTVRRMLVLYPFETAFYEDAGIPVTFVGHPVLESGADRGDARPDGLAHRDPTPGAQRQQDAGHRNGAAIYARLFRWYDGFGNQEMMHIFLLHLMCRRR